MYVNKTNKLMKILKRKKNCIRYEKFSNSVEVK